MVKALARHYRPNSLDGYIGNEKIKKTLSNIFKNRETLPQTILMYGTTGTGKTTLARILAKSYLCENPDEHGQACGECGTCLAMDEYIRTGDETLIQDLNEVDITANGGKADMERLAEDMSYPSLYGGWKIYILDEAQNATIDAQQRLLKELEEPQEKVLVIFCTTNPEKLLDTVQNRLTLKLEVKRPTLTELTGLLAFVCDKEGIKYDLAGLKRVATRSDFVIRESLQQLERVINSQGDALEKSVSEEFAEVTEKVLYDFFQNYLNKDYVGYFATLSKVRVGAGFVGFLREIIAFLTRGLYVINGVSVEGLSDSEMGDLSKLFKKFSVDEIGYLLSSLLALGGSQELEAELMSLVYKTHKNAPENANFALDGAEVSRSDVQKVREALKKEKEEKIVKDSVDSLKDLSEEVDVLAMFNSKKVE